MGNMFGMFGSTGKAQGLSGTGYKQVSIPTMNPQQQQLLSQLLGGSSEGLQGGLSHLGKMASGNQDYFNQLEAPALRQFGALQGNIASRFSGMGSGGRRSSGFQNTLGDAGADLAQRLQSQRLGFQQDAISQLLGLSQNLLGQRTSENALVPKQIPFWKQLLAAGGSGLGNLGSSAGQLGLGKWMGLF